MTDEPRTHAEADALLADVRDYLKTLNSNRPLAAAFIKYIDAYLARPAASSGDEPVVLTAKAPTKPVHPDGLSPYRHLAKSAPAQAGLREAAPQEGAVENDQDWGDYGANYKSNMGLD